MTSQLPDIPQADPAGGDLRQHILLRVPLIFGCDNRHQTVDLRDREAGDADVEVEILHHQRTKLGRQQILVPAGVQGQLVVGQNIGALLCFSHVVDPKAGNLGKTQQLRRFDPAVSGKDRPPVIDQHRVGEPECLDAPGNLAHLLLRMGARIARPWREIANRDPVDVLRGHLASCSFCSPMESPHRPHSYDISYPWSFVHPRLITA